MYTTMVFNLLYKGIHIADGGCTFYEKRLYDPEIDGDVTEFAENSFFWTPKHMGGGIGVDVYEVPGSFQEFVEIYRLLGVDVIVSTRHYGQEDSPFVHYRILQKP